MREINSMFPEELGELMIQLGEKKFRAGQIFKWLHEKLADEYDQMTDLPEKLRERLKEEYPITHVKQEDVRISGRDGNRKYLFALDDGNVIESVWMQYHHGNSVCISSQVGCNMGCSFCASTIGGKVRDLTAAEMLGQIYEITKLTGERVSNVVIMGTGEPFDNYEEVLRFIRMLTHPLGLNLSGRNITLSTCGLVPKIYRFADEKLAVTLAISLHASNDEKRKKIMPVAKVYSVSEIIEAAKYFYRTTGRRVTFEYALIKGENDSDADAAELAALLKGFPCHVNLIPVNPIKERKYSPTNRSETVNFHKKLENYGINGTIRREIAGDINGSCGQLRYDHLNR